MRSRILFISGRPDDARRLCEMLDALPLQVEHASSIKQAESYLRERR